MAKQSPSRSPRGKTQPEQQKTPTFLGAIWGSIKDFFQNIVSKIKDVMEYATRRKNGKTDWENSIEGKAAPKDLTFKSSDQIAEEQIHFPGFHDMTMANGMVRIPAGTEDIWPIEDKQRYLNALHEKFGSIPNPLETHNGAFITDISHDIQRCIKRGINGLSIYGVGNAIITAEIQGSQCKINVSDGAQERSLIANTPKEMRDAIAALYSSVAGKDNAYMMHDQENNATYITRKAQDGEFYTFSVEPHKRHVFNLETQARFVIPNATIDSIVEIQGPVLLEQNIIDALAPIATPMSRAEQHQMVTAMHEVMVDNAPKQAGDSITMNNNPSVYVTQDKMFWLTAEGDHFMAHVAPVRCQYSNIKISHIPLSAESCQPTDDAHSMIYKAISKGARDIDKQIEKRIEHPEVGDLPILAGQAINGVEHGMPIVEVETKNHNIKFEGYDCALPDGSTHRAVSISLDGTLLYGEYVVGDTPENTTIANAGACNTMEDALQQVRNTIRNQRMTRVEQEVDTDEIEPNNASSEEPLSNHDCDDPR